MFHGIVWNYDTLIGQNKIYGIGQYYKCNSFLYLCGNVVNNSDHTCLNNETSGFSPAFLSNINIPLEIDMNRAIVFMFRICSSLRFV